MELYIKAIIFIAIIFILFYFSEHMEKFENKREKKRNGNKPKASDETVHGSAQLMSERELEEELPSYIQYEDHIDTKKCINPDNPDKTAEGPGGLVVYSYYVKGKSGPVKVIYNSNREHNCIIGSTGSGKTTGIIANSIMSIANARATMIIGDPKGELYNQYSNYLKKMGYQVQVLNFSDPSCGQNFNQLDFICQKYAKGMPYLYRANAIGEILKVIKYIISDDDPSSIPEFKGYMIPSDAYGGDYGLNDFDMSKGNKGTKVIDDVDDGDAIVNMLKAIFVWSYKQSCSDYKSVAKFNYGDGSYPGSGQIKGNTKYEDGHVVAQINGQDEAGDIIRNEYLRFKQQQVIQQGLKVLEISNKKDINKYFDSRITYFNKVLTTNEPGTGPYLNAKGALAKYKNSKEEFVQNDKFTTDELIDFLSELQKDYEETFKIYEQEAINNAQTIAEMIVESKQSSGNRGESIWIETPKALLTSLIILVVRESIIPFSQHLGSVFRWESDLSKKANPQSRSSDNTVLGTLTNSLLPTDAAFMASTADRVAGDKTRTSIEVSLVSAMQIFADQTVVSQCSRTSFDVDSIAEKPTAIFLNVPGKDTNQTYTILASLFIEQIYTTLINKAKTYSNISLPRAVYFLIDEFGNIPRIPNFDAKVSLGRSYNIRFNYVIQSLGQLDANYKNEKNTMLGNSNIIYLLTNENDTAKVISERLGTYTAEIVTSSSSTSDTGHSTSKNPSLQKRELYTPTELMDESFKMGKSIYIRPRHNPCECHTIPNYKMPNVEQINSMLATDLNTRRPNETVQYFVPDTNDRNSKMSYQKFIVAYTLFWNDCSLDRYFYKVFNVKAN